MRKDLDNTRKPRGTKEFPARTCKDIYNAHPKFEDGQFFFILNVLFFLLVSSFMNRMYF